MEKGEEPKAADPVEEAWERVDQAWDDPDAHRRFIALSRALGRLPEAGARYRQVREGDPSRREEAATQIERLIAQATQEMLLHRTEASKRPRRVLTFVAALMMLGMVAVAAWAFARGG